MPPIVVRVRCASPRSQRVACSAAYAPPSAWTTTTESEWGDDVVHLAGDAGALTLRGDEVALLAVAPQDGVALTQLLDDALAATDDVADHPDEHDRHGDGEGGEGDGAERPVVGADAQGAEEASEEAPKPSTTSIVRNEAA